jgi:hypothetical protein
MPLQVTIDVFSGRPNPVVTLEGRRATEVLERVKPARPLSKRESKPLDFRLGYRGMVIEQVGAAARSLPRRFRVAAGAIYGEDLAAEIADPEFELAFVEATRLDRIAKGVPDLQRILRKQIPDLHKLRTTFRFPKHRWPVRHRCVCAPLYEPGWWNDGAQRQLHNNCYNYASNHRTDTFRILPDGSQPGAAAGAMYTALTCAAVRPAAIADGVIDNPGANNRCPREGHLVALVIWPGVDFHWYRKGRNGLWTHKPGSTPATNMDNSGHLIADPRSADRGNYTQFCTFMTIMHGHVKIK